MRSIAIYLVVIVFAVCSCKKNTVKNEFYKKLENKCSIQFIGKKDIPVDENVSTSVNYIQYIDDKDWLSIYNKYNNSIYFYDYSKQTYQKQIVFPKEGNNGVGKIQGYDYYKEDSIFVYNYNTQTVYLTNSNPQVLWRKRIPTKDLFSFDFLPCFPFLQTNSPMIYIDNKIILEGFASGETTAETSTNCPVTTIYNFKQDSVFFANNYPGQYQLYHWGGAFYRMPYFTVNKEDKNMIISFPQDHNIYVYSIPNGKQTKYYGGSNNIKQIDAYDEEKKLYADYNENRIADWFYTIPTYRSILYDKYRKLYYRIACLPSSNKLKEVKKYRYMTQPIIVIVLDEKFNYIGECELPDNADLVYTNSFVNKEGLNIQVNTGNEDLLTFHQFKFDIHE